MMVDRISKNEKNIFFGKNRLGVGSDLKSPVYWDCFPLEGGGTVAVQ